MDRTDMDFGAHLPLMDFGGNPYSLDHLISYTQTADRLGFKALSANDHLIFSTPWLDGPTALAAVAAHAGNMTLATTVGLPIVRGLVPFAKAVGAIDLLSRAGTIVAVGPGSSERDYATVGLDFGERWKRLDEIVPALRALWGEGEPKQGDFYSTGDIELLPRPNRPPTIWIGSWGSDAGLRRTARLGDGWLASAYNTTPDVFATAWGRLQDLLDKNGKSPTSFPNALATMWFYITDDEQEAQEVLRARLVPTIRRPEETLRERLPVGSAEVFADKLRAFSHAGVQRVFIWPVADEIAQLVRFHESVIPLLR